MLYAVELERAAYDRNLAGLVLQCPRCRGALEYRAAAQEPTFACNGCYFPIRLRDGIWAALPPERVAYFSRFIADYEMIRAAEGRGSGNPEYYLGLPHKDHSGNNREQWKIRARTYTYLEEHILPKLRTITGAGARILDLGAGNGWMSYRLKRMGFRAVAVDLLVNDLDGLGAAKHYEYALGELFPRFQAENTRLPFASTQFDAVIFNASFHYAENYWSCLAEALRCLKKGGLIVIADSPWYSGENSGERMLEERRAAFLQRFGTLSNSIPSLEYLTDARLGELEKAFGIQWELHSPFYGVRWALRPLSARMQRRREPSRFAIYIAKKAI